MSQLNVRPPEWPLRFLRFFVKEAYLEEIEGDMEEVFNNHIESFGYRKARRMYVWETLKLFRPALIKNLEVIHHLNQHAMFKNYFKTSFRNLIKNPLSSFINVFGLSVAIGICLVVFAFMEYDYSIDQFHGNKKEVYLATFFSDRDGVTQQYGRAPRPLGEVLKQEFPQVKKMCRIEDRNVVLKQEDNVFHETVRYVDPEFLEMFTFPLKWGTTKSLNDLNSIILSEEMSIKYFGEDNPVGRDMLLIFNDSTKKAFTVSGVAAAFPKAHDIQFNFLINFENGRVADPAYDKNDWAQFLNATLIQVSNPSDLRFIEKGIEKYRRLQNEAQPDQAIASFAFEPLVTLHEKSAHLKDAIVQDDNVEGRIGMPIIAIFMIALACFNYINIAIVSAAKRLKEIGVRKVIGASRMKVITQFLTENIVITFFALAIGILLSAFVFLPWFVQFSGWELELKMLSKNLWLFLGALLLFTGLASGIYPAFYISRFEAVKIFKGSLQFGKKNPLTKIFLGVQLVLACVTITAGVVFTQNNRYQYNQSWGYNPKETLYVNVPDQPAFDRLSASLIQNPNVLALSGSKDHLGKEISTTIIRSVSNQPYEVNQLSVDADYFETMGLQWSEGRGFREHSESDKRTIVVNELFVKNLNLTQPIGKVFEMDSIKYEVVGVLKDFHHKSFFHKMQPVIFRLSDEKDVRYLSLRIQSGAEKDTYESLKKNWATLYPEIPFQGGRQEEVWSSYFHSVDRSETFNNIIASIAVLLAGLGLYGLVTLNVSGRIKEFSIRKTLGAGIKNIASVVIGQYVALTAIALLIGAPISYYFTKAYLDMLFAYPMPMDYSGTALALIILVVVLLAVISTQIRKVLKTSSVTGLKTD
jgi:putative ABC transport system permease protein